MGTDNGSQHAANVVTFMLTFLISKISYSKSKCTSHIQKDNTRPAVDRANSQLT